jgi:hypothetical protein
VSKLSATKKKSSVSGTQKRLQINFCGEDSKPKERAQKD